MINILFSQVNKENGFNKEQSTVLNKYIKKEKNIAFIASIFDNIENNKLYYNTLLEYFKKIDITFNKSYLIDLNVQKIEAQKIIQNCDYIFLMGGNPELQMNSINEYDLKKYINQKELVIGVSAGSMNQAKKIVYKDDFDNNKIKIYEGLGLVDSFIFPHYDISIQKIVEEVEMIKEYTSVIALPNYSFIVVENNKNNYYGIYYDKFIKKR